jgi:hypothetical protein
MELARDRMLVVRTFRLLQLRGPSRSDSSPAFQSVGISIVG